MTVGEGEVRRVIRHGVTLGLDAETHIRQREVSRCGLCYGNTLNTVTFLLVGSPIKRLVEFHIRIQRVVLRFRRLLGIGVVQRCSDLHFVGEQLTQFDGSSHGVSLVVVSSSRSYPFFQSTKALGDNLSSDIQRTNIRQLHIKGPRCRPTTIVDCILQTQLVDPHLARFDGSREVTDTNHHGFDFTQRRISQHGDAVVRLVRVVIGERHRITGGTHCTRLVARLLDLREDAKVDIEHVSQRPNGTAVVHIIFIVVTTVWSQFQGYDILIVVVLIVTTHADEDRQLVILQTCGIVEQVVGMDEHLEVFILTQVKNRIAVDSLGLA